MKFLCDTTVLFAASDSAHAHHAASLKLVTTAKPAQAFISTHTLAELWPAMAGRVREP